MARTACQGWLVNTDSGSKMPDPDRRAIPDGVMDMSRQNDLSQQPTRSHGVMGGRALLKADLTLPPDSKAAHPRHFHHGWGWNLDLRLVVLA